MHCLTNRCGVILSVLLAALLWTGCTPPPGMDGTTQSERFLKAGKERAERRDYEGAQTAFEQALAADPANASAHYEIAVLYDQRLNSPEKALYHYIRTLELNPGFSWAETIRDKQPTLRLRISQGSMPVVQSTKLEKTIMELHNELEASTREQQRLLEENHKLRLYISNQLAVAQGPRVTPPPVDRSNDPAPRVVTRDDSGGPVATPPSERFIYTRPRQINYKVQAGDTLFSLSRRYNATVPEILAANPGLTAQTLKAGATITLPVK